MELARLASLYHLDNVLEGCRPVKAVSKGFTNQCVGRCMIPTLASMDLCEQLIALFPGNASH
jgi:hypothetical protein